MSEQPLSFIASARILAVSNGGEPTQPSLKRAISTAYYALFHTMAQNCADTLAGAERSSRSERAWAQTYRGLRHGLAAGRCQAATVRNGFPRDVEDFANAFRGMRSKREAADYDPHSRFAKSEVLQEIDNCEDVIRRFAAVRLKDRRAFAAFVLIPEAKAGY